MLYINKQLFLGKSVQTQNKIVKYFTGVLVLLDCHFKLDFSTHLKDWEYCRRTSSSGVEGALVE